MTPYTANASQAGKGTCPSGASMRNKLGQRHRQNVIARAENAGESEQARKERFKATFAGKKQLDGAAGIAAGLPLPVYYLASVAAAAGAAYGGYTAGAKAPADFRQIAQYGAGAVAGGAVLAGAAATKKQRDSGAGVELWNALVDSEDPSTLDPEVVKGINAKYGVDVANGQLLEVKQTYCAYLQAIIPPGDTPLRGDEHLKLREFLAAVGLPDEDAAMCHIDVGRNFYRQRLEVSGRDAQFEELRSFQKLVYVSSQLFGEIRSGFLTPWSARFGVSPEQVAVAKRDGAKTILKGRIAGEFGNTIPADAGALAALREVQQTVGLTDDAAAKLVREIIAGEVGAQLDAAVERMKTRGAAVDYSPVTDTLSALLARSRAFQSIVAADDAENPRIVPGVGAITVAGTEYEHANKNELVDLYKMYMQTGMDRAGVALSADLAADLDELRAMLQLPERKADDARAKIINDAYTQLLRAAVKSGRMDGSESPASVLNELLTQVSMPGEQALALHESMYRQKLDDCVRDKKIDDEDAAALARTARLLCIPDETVAAAEKEVKGRILRSAIREAMEAGVDGFGRAQRQEVEACKADLRMPDEQAFAVLTDVARTELVKMINAARNKGNKLDNARELKKVVYFSNIVLAPLVEVTKGKDAEVAKEDAMKELAETMAKAKAEADAEEKAEAGAAEGDEVTPASLAKADKAASERADGETITTESGAEITMAAQKDITVADDFALPERVEIYKTYLMFCMTGDVVQLPMGGTIVVERDEQEFARLSQLGDVLGLSQMDVYSVHSAMAEEAYKAQAESLAVGGKVTPEVKEQLDEMATKMGVPEEKAQKIIRGITNKRLVGNLQSMKAQGELTLEKVLELKEQDIDVDSILGESMRMQLFTGHIAEKLASGEGNLDTERLLKGLPEDLKLDAARAAKDAKELAQGKARTIMVQAISYFRQKNQGEAVKYLNNLMACARLSDGDLKGAGKWSSSEEALDLYGLYCQKTESAEMQDELARALELSDADRSAVQEAVKAGTFGKKLATAGPDDDDSGSIF